MRNKSIQALPEDIATRINLVRDIIIDLTDSLDNQKDCWEAWKECNRSMGYLSAKQTMLEVQEEQ